MPDYAEKINKLEEHIAKLNMEREEIARLINYDFAGATNPPSLVEWLKLTLTSAKDDIAAEYIGYIVTAYSDGLEHAAHILETANFAKYKNAVAGIAQEIRGIKPMIISAGEVIKE